MNSQALNCSACLLPYDNDNHSPRFLPKCGHTICSVCLAKILQEHEPKCPIDSSSIGTKGSAIEDYQINFALKQLVQEKSEEICPDHQEKLRLFCFTDQVRICDDCAIFGQHVGHKMESSRQVQSRMTMKTKAIEEMLKTSEQHGQEIEDILKESEASFTRTVKDQFEQFRLLIDQKEIELLSRINSFFKIQREQVQGDLGVNSQLRTDLLRRLANYQTFLTSPDIFSLIQEDISSITSKCSTELFKGYARELDQGLKESLSAFNKSLLNRVLAPMEIYFPMQDLMRKMGKYLKYHEKVVSEDDERRCLSFNTKTILSFQKETNRFRIITEEREPQDTTINMQELKEVTQVSIIFKNYRVTKKDINALFYVLINIDIDQLEIMLCPEGSSDDILIELLPVLFLKANQLRSLRLGLNKCNVSDRSLNLFMQKIFPRLVNLRTLILGLEQTKVTDSIFKAISPESLAVLRTLESFGFSQFYTQITTKSIVDVVSAMNNLKALTLMLDGNRDNSNNEDTKILDPLKNLKLQTLKVCLIETLARDDYVESFAETVLTSQDNLKALEIRFSSQNITDKGVLALLKSLPDLNELCLSLKNTKVTDQVSEELINNTLSKLKNIKKFNFDLSCTQVSEDAIGRLKQYQI